MTVIFAGNTAGYFLIGTKKSFTGLIPYASAPDPISNHIMSDRIRAPSLE